MGNTMNAEQEPDKDGHTTDTTDHVEEGVETQQAEMPQNPDSETGNTEQDHAPELSVSTNQEVMKLKEELAEMKDKYLRMYSEFDNYKRRTAKEKIEYFKTASEDLIKELLPVLDDFERAEKSLGEMPENDPLREGFHLIQHKFRKVLEKQGLKEIEDARGKALDTNLHEAITQFTAPSEDLKGKIIDQVEKGYLLSDKVIRYAKVVVGM
jgi:molecular chaperone GrpE